ncbi:TIGR03790 family protein [Massilia sp. X63]|uniref:TIGR03790 family protein n=1 Tax=Massilia sp. X63 TaxID=3237285 RepID=UPI0034DD9BD3
MRPTLHAYLGARLRAFLLCCLSLLCAAGALHAPYALAATGASALTPRQLAIVINDDDPSSVAVGAYYRKRRAIPAANVVHVRIPGKPRTISPARLRLLKGEIDSQLGPDIQAVLMVWTAPYAVDCNSITSAYTLGFDGSQCAKTCAAGQPSPYFNSKSARPYTDHQMRISMLLPTESVQGAKDLIDRGVAAGFRTVPATAYYLATSEKARNTRAGFFPRPGRIPGRRLATRVMQADVLEGAKDVLVYQTGMAQVPKLETLGFVPGALADHLTSLGGDLLGTSQMSSLRWLEAGATASYGTVSEPCNHWQKFPNPSVLLRHYLSGNSAIEAYWKSVAWPTQGLFIGEPLAAPYRSR